MKTVDAFCRGSFQRVSSDDILTHAALSHRSLRASDVVRARNGRLVDRRQRRRRGAVCCSATPRGGAVPDQDARSAPLSPPSSRPFTHLGPAASEPPGQLQPRSASVPTRYAFCARPNGLYYGNCLFNHPRGHTCATRTSWHPLSGSFAPPYRIGMRATGTAVRTTTSWHGRTATPVATMVRNPL